MSKVRWAPSQQDRTTDLAHEPSSHRPVPRIWWEVTSTREAGVSPKDREVDAQCHQDEYFSVEAREDKVTPHRDRVISKACPSYPTWTLAGERTGGAGENPNRMHFQLEMLEVL